MVKTNKKQTNNNNKTKNKNKQQEQQKTAADSTGTIQNAHILYCSIKISVPLNRFVCLDLVFRTAAAISVSNNYVLCASASPFGVFGPCFLTVAAIRKSCFVCIRLTVEEVDTDEQLLPLVLRLVRLAQQPRGSHVLQRHVVLGQQRGRPHLPVGQGDCRVLGLVAGLLGGAALDGPDDGDAGGRLLDAGDGEGGAHLHPERVVVRLDAKVLVPWNKIET